MKHRTPKFTTKHYPTRGLGILRLFHLRTRWQLQWLNYCRPSHYRGRAKGVYYLVLLAMIFSVCLPVLQFYIETTLYSVDTKASALIGQPNQNLAQKFSYDAQQKVYVFNAAEKRVNDASPAEHLAAQLGGNGKKDKTLYSVDLPTDLKKGITYYDNNLGLSFTMYPMFQTGQGKLVAGRLVYTAADGSKIIFTAKNNGLKEDVVFMKAPKNSEQLWRYELKLPKTLEAQHMQNGSISIRSADPSLYSNVTYGDEADAKRVENARQTAEKSNVVFVLPAPVIREHKPSSSETAHARFLLSQDGSILTVSATGIDKQLQYPISVDPSVVITSTTDFSKGNNEGNIDFPADQINRGGLTGGSVGTWTASTAFTTARYGHTTVAYNGYLYVIGGTTTGSDYLNNVQYAPINSDGTVGSWTATTNLISGRQYHASVAYNGYIYVIGGSNGTSQNSVQYALINADGSVGAWSTTTAFTTARIQHTSVAYNGYLYVIGGYTGSALNTVQYALINADGSVGSWTATTAYTTASYRHGAVAYNGYMYVVGGYNGSYLSSVQYASINADGTVGTWSTTTAITTARYGHGCVVYNGYLYVIGGYSGSYQNGTQYASINANGTVGPWSATSTLTNARITVSAAYNNNLYLLGGWNGSTPYADVQYVKIDPAGITSTYTSDSADTSKAWGSAAEVEGSVAYLGGCSAVSGDVCSTPTASNELHFDSLAINPLPAARGMGGAFTYNGSLYYIAGRPTSTTLASNMYYHDAGTWTNKGSFTGLSARYGFTALTYDNNLYIIGGCTTASGACTAYENTVLYAKLDETGSFLTNPSCANTFCPLTALSTARMFHTAAIEGNKLYVAGGVASGPTNLNDVQYATINSDGTIGSWTSTTAFTTARYGHMMWVERGYIYISSGKTASSTFISSVYFARLTSSGAIASDSGCGSAWCTAPSVPVARGGAANTKSFRSLTVIGGQTGNTTVSSVVYYTDVANGGQGISASQTTPVTGTISSRKYHQTVAYNGFLYVLGGISGGGAYLASVQYGVIGSTGDVASWASTTSFTTGRCVFRALAYKGYMYVLGGEISGGGSTTSVQYAPINSNGTLGTWSAATALPVGYMDFGAASNNGYMYVGGGSGTAVYYVSINANGTLGASWTAATSLPYAGANSAVAYNNYLYIDDQFAPINTDGSIGNWAFTGATPQWYWWGYDDSSDCAAANGFMYCVYLEDYYDVIRLTSMPILSNGFLGEQTQLPVTQAGTCTSRDSAAYAYYKGNVYVTGGDQCLTNAEFIGLTIQPRVGSYSDLTDLGSLVDLRGISYNGMLPNAASNIYYRAAGTNGVFGSLTLASSLPGGSGSSCNPSDWAGGTTRYVWVSASIDDSQRAAFPDANTTPANLTDITISYDGSRPPPNKRLMHGKWFNNETLQPLDTCGP